MTETLKTEMGEVRHELLKPGIPEQEALPRLQIPELLFEAMASSFLLKLETTEML